MKTQIRTSTLKASLHCVAVKDARYYLLGVLFDFKQKHIVIVSTDGHCLSAFVETPVDYSPERQEQVITPSDVIKSAIKLAGKDDLVDFESIDGKYSLGGIQFGPIAARYPDYRIIPTTNTEHATAPQFYSPELMQKCVNAMRDFYNQKRTWFPCVTFFRESCALHVSEETAVTVLMPWRADNAPFIGLRAD